MSDADSVDAAWGAAAQAARTGASTPLWQVNTRGRKVVEMTLAELSGGVKSGKLSARTLVWCEGMPAWTPLGEVPELERASRVDSEPPASGARLIAEEAELVLLAGTKSYASLGSEPPTDPGTTTLAIYERPLATIEFPEAIEPAPESVDEPTPAFAVPAGRVTLPGLAPEDLIPIPSSTRAVAEPPVPPLPPRPQAGFPSPVTSSPLGAVLSSMTGASPVSTPVPQRSKPQHDVPSNSYAVAKATPLPTLRLSALASALDDDATTVMPRPILAAGASSPSAPITPRPLAPSSSSPPRPSSPSASSSPPQKPSSPSASSSATITPRPLAPSMLASATPRPLAPSTSSTGTTPVPGATPAVNTATSTPKPLAPSAAGSATVTPAAPNASAEAAAAAKGAIVPPRPAIEFLPPIIVQEKEDDGASIITLPLDANFHESTLVLAGRRRPRRWVPLGAAVAAAVGSACLASALTALLTETRPPATRIVEKKVLVPVAAPATATVETPAARPASTTAAAPAERAPAPALSPEPEKRTASERPANKGEASAKAWRKDDPGALEQAPVTAQRVRAGFPTNPGF